MKIKKKIVDKTVIDNSIKSEKLSSFDVELMDTMIFNNFSVIPLETNDDNLFRNIDRIAISNKRIFIFDKISRIICIYDEKGNHINQIHIVGQGPNTCR